MDELNVQEYLMQGTLLSGQGKYQEAIAYYDKAQWENPMEINVYLSKGIAYANLSKLEEAKEQFEKALKINKTSGLAYFHLGSIELLQGYTSSGFENYNKAISNGYDNAQLYYSLGLLYEENGDIDMAVRNYSKSITRDARRPDIRIRKARLLLNANRIPEALQALDETILTNPDVFEGYHLKFSVLLQTKDYQKAADVLESAIELFPKDYEFVIDKVRLFVDQNKTEEALALLFRLENEEDVQHDIMRRVYMERAQIYAAKEDVKSAISALEQARGLADKEGFLDSEVMFLLVNCYLSAQEYDKALEYTRQLLEKSDEGYIKETARYFEPFALKRLGRMDEALPLYRKAIDSFRNQALAVPGNLDAYLLRTMCLRDIDECNKALELIDYVIALLPEHSEPHLLRVSILEGLGRNDEAAEEAKLVSKTFPNKLNKKIKELI